MYISFSGEPLGLGLVLVSDTHKSEASIGFNIGPDGKAVDNTSGSTEGVMNVVCVVYFCSREDKLAWVIDRQFCYS